jgi:thiol-disulfide isomerase/thioredoxin
MDNSDGGLTQAGHVLGMIMTIFWALVLILGMIALATVAFLLPTSSGHDYGPPMDTTDASDFSGYYDSQDEMGMHDEGNPMGIDMGMAAGGDDTLGDLEDTSPLGSAIRQAASLHAEGMGNGFNPTYDKFIQSGDILLGLVETYGKAEIENYPFEFQTFLYNAACAYSLDDNIEKSLIAYKLAVEFGWDDFAHTARDSDLKNLRESDGYQQYQGTFAKIASAKATEWAASELASGSSFVFDVDLTSVNDSPVKLSDHKGKVVIVDFWGTWCPPCRAEVPSFIRLQKEYGERGFQMIGLNYEGENSESDAENVRRFIKSEEINYPCALGDDATSQQVPALNSYPTTLFIDKSGKVRTKLVGLHSYERLAAIVETLMAEQ